jgi:hypothetical protein
LIRAIARFCLAFQHGGSVDFAPLKKSSQDLDRLPGGEDQACITGIAPTLLLDLRSIVIMLPAVDDKKI